MQDFQVWLVRQQPYGRLSKGFAGCVVYTAYRITLFPLVEYRATALFGLSIESYKYGISS